MVDPNANDEELEKVWMEDFQEFMDQARKAKNSNEEFAKQQEIYNKYAETYDRAVGIELYSGPEKIADRVNQFYPDNKDINILDYGCGTGLAADHMAKLGFKNIDGLDPNKGLLDAARKKGVMKNYYQLRSDESHSEISGSSYDVVCSTGAFFLSSSHPGFECVKELCRLIKPNGYLIILTKNAYLECDYVDHSKISDLEKEGVLKSFPKELYAGYRKTFEFEEDQKSTAAILIYQKL